MVALSKSKRAYRAAYKIRIKMLAAIDCSSPFPELNRVEATWADDLRPLALLLLVFLVWEVMILPIELDMAPPAPVASRSFVAIAESTVSAIYAGFSREYGF